MAQFLDRIERREIDHDAARHHRPVIGGHIGGDVGQEQADPFPLADPAFGQPGGEAPRIGIKVGIGEGAPHEANQRCPGALVRLPREQIVQQHRADGAVPRIGMAIGIAGGRQWEALIYSHVSIMHRPKPRCKPACHRMRWSKPPLPS